MQLMDLPLKKETKANLLLKVFALWKIPLIRFVGAKITRLDDHVCEVKIPLNRKTKNHLKSMYFGSLAIGADLAAGLAAMVTMMEMKTYIHLSFKDFRAVFKKRAEGDVIFRCESVGAIKQLVKRAIETKERVEMLVPVSAHCKNMEEPVATFQLTLSLKKK